MKVLESCWLVAVVVQALAARQVAPEPLLEERQ